mgnify:CR=1 FL=1
MVVGEKWAHQAAQLVQKHPRRLTAIVGTCLLAVGSGAFAVASYAPDASDLPVREVLQAHIAAGGGPGGRFKGIRHAGGFDFGALCKCS